MAMNIRFFTFSAYHGKTPSAGSTIIRVDQLLDYWPEAALYKFGEKPDVLIFQKVYVTPDYKFPIHFPGIKILDICDPDHVDGAFIKQTIDAVDAVTCPTVHMATFIKQFTDKPVVVIPDRYDLKEFPKPRTHTESGKTVVWFGYRHNAETLKPAMDLINRCGLNLLVIADDDPMPWQWLPPQVSEDFRYNRYQYLKHSNDYMQLHLDLQLADFAVLPKGTRPVDAFKSDNKATRAILCGLPVAYFAEDVRTLIDAGARTKFMEENYEKTRAKYDVRRSVDQYKDLIKQLTENR
jgi:hypothetical protein